MIKMKAVRYFLFLLVVLLPVVIHTAVAETNEPEAVESLVNWESAQKLTGDFNNTPNGAQRPIIAIAPNRDVIVVYLKQQSGAELDTDPFYVKSTQGGDPGTWSDPARIHLNALTSRQVDVAFDPNSKAHAVWTEGNDQLWYGNEDDWGSNGSSQLFSSAEILIESPKIAIGDDGIIHLVWSQADFLTTDIFYARSTNGGASWIGPTNVSSSNASSESPSIALDAFNRPNVVWEEQVGGTEYKINLSRRKSNGTWETPVGISDVVTSLTSAREPDITINDGRIFVILEDRVSTSQQTLYYLDCISSCFTIPATTTNWRPRPATVQAFGAKDSDPTFLVPKIVNMANCRTVFFSGITGNVSTNNEKIRLGNSCNGFSSNPIIDSIEASLGTNDRAIKPSAVVQENWLVFVAYEHKGTSRSDIYLARNQPATYLPVIVK